MLRFQGGCFFVEKKAAANIFPLCCGLPLPGQKKIKSHLQTGGHSCKNFNKEGLSPARLVFKQTGRAQHRAKSKCQQNAAHYGQNGIDA